MTAKAKKPYDEKALERRLSKALTTLVLDYPFIGNIALNLPFSISEKVPTAGTNGREIFYNPNFISELTDRQLLFLVAHEVFHPMFNHCTRRGGRDPMNWNIAADYVINRVLVEDGIGDPPPGILDDKAFHDKHEGITDRIYNALPPAKQGQSPGDGSLGSSLDDCQDASGNGDDTRELEAEWEIRTAQAATVAKMAGKLSAGMERLVGNLLNPKVPWQDVMRRFMAKVRTDHRSWARPNRRFLSQGLIMPSISGEAMGEVVFAIDCSGSVGEKELTEFATEVTAAQQETNPLAIHIVYFDSKVCHYDMFERGEDVTIKPHGGGGTAFSPIFKYIHNHGIEPVACVVLTDLYCDDFGNEPDYPVLWVTNAADKAPWGEIIKM